MTSDVGYSGTLNAAFQEDQLYWQLHHAPTVAFEDDQATVAVQVDQQQVAWPSRMTSNM